MEALYATVNKLRSIETREISDDMMIVEEMISSRFGNRWRSLSEKIAKKRSINFGTTMSSVRSSSPSGTYYSDDGYSGSNGDRNSPNIDSNNFSDEDSINTEDVSNLLANYQRLSTDEVSELDVALLSNSNHYDSGNFHWSEMDVQQERIFQIQKALSLCGSSFSIQRIEAQRLLLIATEKKKILEDGFNSYYERMSPATGKITFSNVQLMSYNIYEKNTMYYFVCLWFYGPDIISSNIIMSKRPFVLDIEGTFVFNDLPSDFEIKLKIYVMEEKKAFKWDLINPCYRPVRESEDRYNSAFKLWAEIDIGPHNVTSLPTCLNLFDNPTVPSASWIKADYALDVDFNAYHEGFLDVALVANGCPYWNKMWCVLDGTDLKYWSYPSQKDYTPCLNSVNLFSCNRVRIGTENVHFRKWTLTLSLDDGVTYFLSAESESAMNAWYKVIDQIIETHKIWKKFTR